MLIFSIFFFFFSIEIPTPCIWRVLMIEYLEGDTSKLHLLWLGPFLIPRKYTDHKGPDHTNRIGNWTTLSRYRGCDGQPEYGKAYSPRREEYLRLFFKLK